MSKKNFKIKDVTIWNIVEECLTEKTSSGYKMALIEAEKILQGSLRKSGYPGKNGDERIVSAEASFTNIKKLRKARDITKIILEELNYNLNSLEVEEASKAYHQALMDIEGNPDAQLNILQRIKALITYYIPSKKRLFLGVSGTILGTLLFIVFLADTKMGNSFAQSVVALAHFIFSWVLTGAILVIGIVTIITLTILYFERKRKGKVTDIEL